MRINEIFYSIQGEGIFQGVPMVFIRLQGCNVRCSWCDTQYAQDPSGGIEMSIEQIVKTIRQLVVDVPSCSWVCITGGEPLMQGPKLRMLVETLNSCGFDVEIETNGTLPKPTWFVPPASWCVDVKCPSSKILLPTRSEWFTARASDQIKFVVANQDDLTFTEKHLSKISGAEILISPMIGLLQMGPNGTKRDYHVTGAWLQECVEFAKRHNLRFSLQLHKFIWEPEMRGV